MQIRKSFSLPNLNTSISIEKNFRVYLANLMNSSNSSIAVFSNICAGLKIVENPDISTMCVSISNGHYLLQYSPKMVEELDLFGTSIVLCHEMAHLSLGHTARMLRFFESIEDKETLFKYKQVVHQAADYAVNSWLIDVLRVFTLDDLKTKIGSLQPNGLGKYAGIHPSDVNLPTGKSLEWYVGELAAKIEDLDFNDLMDKLKDSMGEGGEGGDCDLEKLMTEALKQAAGSGCGSLINLKNVPKDILEKLGKESNNLEQSQQSMREDSVPEGKSAAEVAQNLGLEAGDKLGKALEGSKSRGTLPAGLQELFTTMYMPPKVRWQDVLQRFCKSSRPSDKERTIVKPKRKYADLGSGFRTSEFPGTKKNPQYNILFAVDTSGSVSNEDIQLIMAELDALSKDKTVTVTVVEADTMVHKMYDLKSTKQGDRNVYGRGGTDFDDVFKLASSLTLNRQDKLGNKLELDSEVDLLIYATDGECTNPKQDYRIPSKKVLWLSTTGTVPSNSSWGTKPKSEAMFGEAEYGRYIVIK